MASRTRAVDVMTLDVDIRPSTEKDMAIALQGSVFHHDPVVEIAYNLGGAVAVDREGRVFRAPDDEIEVALAKAAKSGLISHDVSAETWLKQNAGRTAMIEEMAQRMMRKNSSDLACDILQSLLSEHEQFSNVCDENKLFREHRKLQVDWNAHRARSLRLEQKKLKLLEQHRMEDVCQTQENHLRLQQVIQQEKVRQKLLDQENQKRRSSQLEEIQREYKQQQEAGGYIKQREQDIFPDLNDLSEKGEEEESSCRSEHKEFLQALLERLKN